MKVVVGLDTSPDALDVALAKALELGPQHEFFLVHVDEVNKPSYFDPFHDKIDRVVNEQVHEAGDVLSQAIKERMSKFEGYTWTLARREGDARVEIREYARSIDADLVVVGTRGLGAISNMILGSVSAYLTQHLHCSVLVARRKSSTSDDSASH